jgi:hypothetical protein
MEQSSIANRIASALSENLTQQEISELDEIITPRAGKLFVKAFGPDMAPLLAPFTEGDEEQRESPIRGESEKAINRKEAELRSLVRDPRYWREKDPAFVARVENGFKKLFPGTH